MLANVATGTSTKRVSLMKQRHSLRLGATDYLVYRDSGVLRSRDKASLTTQRNADRDADPGTADRAGRGRSRTAYRRGCPPRWRFGAVLALLASLGVLVAGEAPAQAHAVTSGSNHADRAVLDTATASPVVRFTESVILAGTRVEVADSSGHVVRVGPPALSAAVEPADAAPAAQTEEPVSVSVALPSIARGSHRVSWSTVSADGLHPTSGVLVFGVQEAVTAQGWVESAPCAVEAALRWMVLFGIATGVGAPVAAAVVRRVTADDPDGSALDLRVVDRAAAVAAGVATLAAITLLLEQVSVAPGAVRSLLTGGYAVRWGLREAGLLLLLATALGRLHGSRRSAPPLTVAGALTAALGTSLLGHSGSGLLASPTRVAASTLHVLATGAWLGALAMLCLVVVRSRPGQATTRRLLVGFGVPPAVAVSVMVVTGIYLASGVVGSVDALLLTDYGRVLVVKVGLVGGCGALALVTRHRVRRSGRPARRFVLAEAAVGVVVLGLTGVLTSGQPALEPELVVSGPPSTGTAYQRVGDLHESFAVKPNRPGDNVLLLEVHSARRPDPGPVIGVRLGVVDGSGTALPVAVAVAATDIGDGHWSAPISLGAPGAVTVRATVLRAGLAAETFDYAWSVGSAPGAAPALVSRTPVGGLLAGTAAVVAVVLALLWGALARRRLLSSRAGVGRHPRTTPPPAPTRAPVDAGSLR